MWSNTEVLSMAEIQKKNYTCMFWDLKQFDFKKLSGGDARVSRVIRTRFCQVCSSWSTSRLSVSINERIWLIRVEEKWCTSKEMLCVWEAQSIRIWAIIGFINLHKRFNYTSGECFWADVAKWFVCVEYLPASIKIHF